MFTDPGGDPQWTAPASQAPLYHSILQVSAQPAWNGSVLLNQNYDYISKSVSYQLLRPPLAGSGGGGDTCHRLVDNNILI